MRINSMVMFIYELHYCYSYCLYTIHISCLDSISIRDLFRSHHISLSITSLFTLIWFKIHVRSNGILSCTHLCSRLNLISIHAFVVAIIILVIFAYMISYIYEDSLCSATSWLSLLVFFIWLSCISISLAKSMYLI
jgi:hypothetical protein